MLTLHRNESEPVKSWLIELKRTKTYKEPVLKKPIVNFIHLVCNALEQDAHVFILSVDLLEEYLDTQDSDVLLTILVVVFICSKIAGEQSELKIKHITTLYENLTTLQLGDRYVSYTEIVILNNLQQKVPFTSQLDDLKLLYFAYFEPKNLKRTVMHLCVKLLELIYINKYNFFFELKTKYEELNMLDTFNGFICSKFYLNCGIILASLTITKYQNFFDIKTVTFDFSNIACIHKDHFEMLHQMIVDLFNNSKNN